MNTNRLSERPILIVGGTGKTGRRVADRLAAQGVPTRIGSRTGEPPFDWENRATWAPALKGTAAAYVTYYPDLAIPGAAEDIAQFAGIALENGVNRLVLLSGRGEEGALEAEQALQRSGVDWTIVRASTFCQNFSESFLLGSVLSGTIALPIANISEPFVDADDIADVAAAALSDDRHIGQLYEVTGPRSITFTEAADEIARASGRPLQFVQITQEAFIAGMEQASLPEDYMKLLIHLFTQIFDGRNSGLTDGVQRALGREPRDFRTYTEAAAATGVWDPV